MAEQQYEVKGLRCPVVVIVACEENGGLEQRCGQSVFVHIVYSEPSWNAKVFGACAEGHELESFRRYASRDLDGVPIGA